MATMMSMSIDSLRDNALEMMRLAKASLVESVLSLDDRDVDLAKAVIDRDARIDAMERQLEAACLELLAGKIEGRALRTVAATFKIVGDVERIGDYCVSVAGVTISVANKPVTSNALDITRMAEIIAGMLQACMDAYAGKARLDIGRVFEEDEKADRLFNDIYKSSVSSILHEPGSITNLLYLLSAARAMERIGDHVTDIAERIQFIETGELVKRKEPMHIPEFH